MRVNSPLCWGASQWFSMCGPRNRSVRSIWELLTNANSWPRSWPAEWKSLGLGHTNLFFNKLCRWFKDKNHWPKKRFLKLAESLFFLKRFLTFWILAWGSYIPQISKCSLSLVPVAPKEELSKSMCFWDIFKLFNNSHCSFGPSGNQPSPASWAQSNRCSLKILSHPQGSHPLCTWCMGSG